MHSNGPYESEWARLFQGNKLTMEPQCFSHLTQISAMADNNLLIEKQENDGRTLTKVKQLDNEEKVLEIARLISGYPDSNTAIEHAKEIISSAIDFKNSL